MDSIIQLLQEKNNNLEKFYRLNEAELENFAAGDFNHLEEFYSNREGLLTVVKKIDDMIEKSNETAAAGETISAEQKLIIHKALQYKNDLVNKILAQDLEILSVIEIEKSNMIKELTQVRATKKALGSYKSGTKKSNLDEEA